VKERIIKADIDQVEKLIIISFTDNDNALIVTFNVHVINTLYPSDVHHLIVKFIIHVIGRDVNVADYWPSVAKDTG
jgi:hypothetical protein